MAARMKKCLGVAVFLICLGTFGRAQAGMDTITEAQVGRWLQFLASDSLGGRGNYSSGLDTAAHFIADGFRQWQLQPLPGLDTYFHTYILEEEQKRRSQNAGGPGQSPLANVVALLPGRSKPDEWVIFSAHYDHLGTIDGTIYNGANDNASGTAALMALAQYYSLRADNERTLVFCAFSGEELGLLGSTAFALHIAPEQIKAVINLEMLGRHNTVGRQAIFITGAHYSDFAKIFQRNVKGIKFKVRSEPDAYKQLFRRSDNFPFALKGIAAHTLMSSDDDDACYHNACDDLDRIDIPNLVQTIRAVATGVATIVSGSDTPKRINPKRIY